MIFPQYINIDYHQDLPDHHFHDHHANVDHNLHGHHAQVHNQSNSHSSQDHLSQGRESINQSMYFEIIKS